MLSDLVLAEGLCKNFYRTYFDLMPGEIILVGERHNDSSLKYIYSQYEKLLMENKIFLAVEGELISDSKLPRFGLESEFAINLSLLASAKGFLELRSEKSLNIAIQRLRSLNVNFYKNSYFFNESSELNLLRYNTVVNKVANLFNWLCFDA